jgi:hypothetical protein
MKHIEGPYTREISKKPRRLKKVINPRLDVIRSDNTTEENTVTSAATSTSSATDSTVKLQYEHNQLEYQYLAPPSRHQTLYQLCDIKDAKIQKLLKDCNKSKCDKDTGWLTRVTIQKIQDIMKNKIPKLESLDYAVEESVLPYDQFLEEIKSVIAVTPQEKGNKTCLPIKHTYFVETDDKREEEEVPQEHNDSYEEEEDEEDIFEHEDQEEDPDLSTRAPITPVEDIEEDEWMENMDLNDEPFDLLDE